MKSVAIFCGSSEGNHPEYKEQAYLLGKVLAGRGMRVIYGGARIGLMGAVADGALDHGGEVIGVIPEFLQTKEVAHEGLTDLIVVDTMHERKLKMHELSDAIITLPGGFGTMEELFEMLTWAQLGLHGKPIGVLNTRGFYTDLFELADRMVNSGFLKANHRDMLLNCDNIDELITEMKAYEAPELPKWISKQTT
ncbi:LOG family protein [Taibaiella soli]|uniref:Cytokinin riboside 5'-monophosphate phosphoribohydrolase n=1 Tax=Taibaiella soli TaxID=1649169 RepID=A0A2W2B0H8_9BACT|nr:TIGR00730 family Rossman fold protein [Taibaiella soli]PZF73764.1 TIGR00730 family Rossman fold protein [Taibaiella soli]